MAESTSPSYRWLQLIAGIVCMILITYLHYGWTLFVQPKAQAHGWTIFGIQLAFSILIALETWGPRLIWRRC